jgi:hypothetical protein
MYRPSNTVVAVLAIVFAIIVYLWRLIQWYRIEQFKAYPRLPPHRFWGHLKLIGEAMKELPKGASSGESRCLDQSRFCFYHGASYLNKSLTCSQTMAGNGPETNTHQTHPSCNSTSDLPCHLQSTLYAPTLSPRNVPSLQSRSGTLYRNLTPPRHLSHFSDRSRF